MSYILEALKKSQAERQLGNAPTIHAPPMHASSGEAPGRRSIPAWTWLLALCILLAVALAVLAWPQSAPSPSPGVVVAQAPLAALPAPAPELVPAPAPAPPPKPKPVAKPKPKPKPKPVAPPEPKPEPAPQHVVAEPSMQERIPGFDELPETVRRTLPQLVIGGYIYSKNPADRLLLIDKVLRREGDQVAPGLTLEKLLPKAVVLNYNGVRYQLAY